MELENEDMRLERRGCDYVIDRRRIKKKKLITCKNE